MSPNTKGEDRRRLHAMKVHQWLPEWNEVEFDSKHFRAKPPESFFLFTIPATDLARYRASSVEALMEGSHDLAISASSAATTLSAQKRFTTSCHTASRGLR